MSIIISSLVISAIIGFFLRLLFRLKGAWLALIWVGFLPPILMVPLSIFYSLVEVGRQQTENAAGAVSTFAQIYDNGLLVAAIWFGFAIAAAMAIIWLSKRK